MNIVATDSRSASYSAGESGDSQSHRFHKSPTRRRSSQSLKPSSNREQDDVCEKSIRMSSSSPNSHRTAEQIPNELTAQYRKREANQRKIRELVKANEEAAANYPPTLKRMRRLIRPEVPIYIYARYAVDKFYRDHYDYFTKPKDVDWNRLAKRQSYQASSSQTDSSSRGDDSRSGKYLAASGYSYDFEKSNANSSRSQSRSSKRSSSTLTE